MRIEENLEKLNFTKLETQIYLALLGTKPLSAYQLAKKIDIARTSIYNALEHMLKKGMVELIPNNTALYIAQDPAVLLGKINYEMKHAIEESEKQLKEYKNIKQENINSVLKGFDIIIQKAKSILIKAKNEVYINSDFDLDCFIEELKILKTKNIKVIVFSFYNINPGEAVDFYSHYRNSKNHMASRLMLVVDNEISLIADKSRVLQEWNATISNNALSIKVVSEHIHNDIYLLKLRNQFGKDMYDNLYVNTNFEERQKEEEKHENNGIWSN